MSVASECIMVPLGKIPIDETTQTRVKVRTSLVREYAAAMTEQLVQGGLRFPPVILFSDGAQYWLADGFHRVQAAALAGLTEITAEVWPGRRREAFLFSISANSEHGLPRSNADKRKAVTILLADAEWSQWSNREIARRCHVDHNVVDRLRPGASGVKRQMRVQRAGAVYEMNVNVNKSGEGAPSQDAAGCDAHPAVTWDALGIAVPESRIAAFAARRKFQDARDLLDRLAALIDEIARESGGAFCRTRLLESRNDGQVAYASALLRRLRSELVDDEPHCGLCPNCHATHPVDPYPTCPKCGGRGWTSRSAFESCMERDQDRIRKLRTPEPNDSAPGSVAAVGTDATDKASGKN